MRSDIKMWENFDIWKIHDSLRWNRFRKYEKFLINDLIIAKVKKFLNLSLSLSHSVSIKLSNSRFYNLIYSIKYYLTVQYS